MERAAVERRRASGALKVTHRRSDLKRNFGITIEQYDAMLAQQDGRCAICRTDACITGRRLAVDHDHATGKVRGLLCMLCNKSLERFDNVPCFATLATAYIERTQ